MGRATSCNTVSFARIDFFPNRFKMKAAILLTLVLCAILEVNGRRKLAEDLSKADSPLADAKEKTNAEIAALKKDLASRKKRDHSQAVSREEFEKTNAEIAALKTENQALKSKFASVENIHRSRGLHLQHQWMPEQDQSALFLT